jgi:hypothetical protein
MQKKARLDAGLGDFMELGISRNGGVAGVEPVRQDAEITQLSCLPFL